MGTLGSVSYLPTFSSMTLSCFLPGTSAAHRGGRHARSRKAEETLSEGRLWRSRCRGRSW